jgi:DNA-binding MarR family transcriptional regulator
MSPPSDFVESLGPAFFAHRLRRLSEALVEEGAAWLPGAGITAPPKAGSTLMLLEAEGPLSVTEIAARLRLTHPLIVKLARELEALGLVRAEQDPADGRRRPLFLTAAGRRQAARLARLNARIARAYGELFAEAGVDAFAAVVAVERALTRRSLAQRLGEPAETPA